MADAVPLYPLYALLFADAGLSDTRISGLFAVWTAVAVVAEVPAGAVADRFGRRRALAGAALLQAGGYLLWVTLPEFAGFAAGFVLWGVGGALASGSLEALLYDGLARAGADEHYARVYGRVSAVGLLVQVPNALVAALLFRLGGYQLAGVASIGTCLVAAALALRLPEQRAPVTAGGAGAGCLTMLRAGVHEAAALPAVRTAVLAVALLTGFDALEEYVPLLARDWGVPTALNPLAVLVVTLGAAAGAALAGPGARLGDHALTTLLGAAVVLLTAAGLLHRPLGLGALAAYALLFQLVLVVAAARLQDRIESDARATVTSVASLGTELAALGLLGAWAVGGLALVTALLGLTTLVLPRVLRGSTTLSAPAP